MNQKTIKQYVSEENSLVCWGGKDSYEFKYVHEKKDELMNGTNGSITESFTDVINGSSEVNGSNEVKETTNGHVNGHNTNLNGKMTNKKVS